jgi:Uma2 family endonuclease
MSNLTNLEPLAIEDAVLLPPTELDSDEPPLESDLHLLQIKLLLDCLGWWWRDRTDFYASANTTVYYSETQLKSRDFRGPDFYVVLGVERRPRKSWIVWAEGGRTPDLVVEILSDSTANVDRGLKKQLYQDVLKVNDYFWFHPETLEFAGFHLLDGEYHAIAPTAEGLLWSEQLQLFFGIHAQKLRYFTPEGQLIPSLEEVSLQEMQRAEQQAQRAEQEAQRAEQEAQRAEQEAQRATRLAEKLRELGIDPESV